MTTPSRERLSPGEPSADRDVWRPRGTVVALTAWAMAALGLALVVNVFTGAVSGLLTGGGVLLLGAGLKLKHLSWPTPEQAALLLILGSVLVPFSLFPPLGRGLSADDVGVVLGAAIAAVLLWRHRGAIRVPVFAWPLALLTLWAAIIWLTGDRTLGALLRGPGRLGLYLVLVVAGALWFRRASLARFAMYTIVVVASVEALFAVFSYFAPFQILDRFIGIETIRAYDPIYTLAPGRAVGTLGLASNFLGAYMLIPAALILGFGTIALHRREVVAWSALYVLVFWALALTYTRASLIAVVVGAAGYFVWTRRTRMLPAFALALVSVLLFTPFLSRFSLGNDRARLTSQAIEVIREHPVAGVGAGEYTPEGTSSTVEENQSGGPDRSITPHNSFLLYASELGIPGGLLALLAVALPFLGALGRSPRGSFDSPAILAAALAGGLGSFALQTLSNNLLHIPVVTVQFWIAATVGVMVSLHADGSLARRMAAPIRLR